MPQLKGKTVLLIGAGPTRIGQSGECDQGAVEACDTLKAMGCRVIAVDANPDAVLTDKGIAHQRYVEPLTSESIKEIISIERPDAVLLIFAGRTGLHLAGELAGGAAELSPVPLWGTPVRSLKQVQDRDGLKAALEGIQLKSLTIFSTPDLEAASAKAQELGFPVVLRCDNEGLMTDGALVYNQEELSERAGLMAADAETVLSVEESLWQWRQVELEVLRDAQGQILVAGAVEYMECAGIHPGDAIGITPPQTISDSLRQLLEKHARAIADHLGIMGNATLRFAFDPKTEAVLTTAVHPRFTRTSAFISRISGIPVAGLAALLSAGISLKQLPKPLAKAIAPTEKTPAIGVKWPVWDFERLGELPDRLGPQMQATGQSLGIGSTFTAALQKALRGADPEVHGLNRRPESGPKAMAERLRTLATPTSHRMYTLYEALVQGAQVETLAEQARIDPWYIRQMASLVALEEELNQHRGQLPPDDLLRQAKINGFSDRGLARILAVGVEEIARRRSQIGLQCRWLPLLNGTNKDAIHFAAYGNEDPPVVPGSEKEGPPVLILGSGPTRIGLGSACDHGIFHAARTARAAGFKPLILHCNLTGVSMGRAMAGQGTLLVDILDQETVQSIIEQFKPMGVITQFAGNRPLERRLNLEQLGMLMLGGSPEAQAILSDRASLCRHIRSLGIPLPASAVAENNAQATQKASEIGFPLLLRPAVAQKVQAPQLIQSSDMLAEALSKTGVGAEHPLFMERFLEFAIEAQAEVLSDGDNARVATVLEQIELAGVNAGDSACVLPPYTIGPRHVETITEYAVKVALSLKIKGALNLRFAVYRDSVYWLDVTCRECRNWSMITKAVQMPLAELATRIQLGQSLKDLSLTTAGPPQRVSVRAAVFPFNVFTEMDPLLGPGMRSTGAVMATADSFGMAYFKAQQAADTPLPTQGGVLITVTSEDKPSIIEPARIFNELGFHLMATRGTQSFLVEHGLKAEMVRKLGFGRPNLVDEMKNGKVQMVINTPSGDQGHKDGGYIRKAAILRNIANINTPAGAVAAAKGIAARRKGGAGVRALED